MSLFGYTRNKFRFDWCMSDGYPQSIDGSVTPSNFVAFGTFISGGGSTMGCKLAGFNHLGGVEIDPKTCECYRENHNPELLYNMDIRDFNELAKLRDDSIPSKLFDFGIDLFECSPPCTTFSMAGNREKTFGKLKKFKEGNKLQTLDDLLFVGAETIGILKPKTFVLENVKGLTMRHGRAHFDKCVSILSDAGYDTYSYVLDGSKMGLPQMRERLFIVGRHRDIGDLHDINLNYSEKQVPFGEISDSTDTECALSEVYQEYWKAAGFRESVGKFEAVRKLSPDHVAYTMTASNPSMHPYYMREINLNEMIKMSSFPRDFKFLNHKPNFYMGMCVAPLMMANIAYQVRVQWLERI